MAERVENLRVQDQVDEPGLVLHRDEHDPLGGPGLAPTDPIPVVRAPHKLELLRWGLTLDNPKAGGFNARVESLGLYRRTQRCLVVVSGFYEWRRLDAKTKQPHLIRRIDGAPMVFAGFADGTDGCAIVTAPAKGRA